MLEDVGEGENGAKAWIVLKYSLACPKIKLWKKHLWVGGSCSRKGTKLELAAKAWAFKKKSSYKFFQSLIRKCIN